MQDPPLSPLPEEPDTHASPNTFCQAFRAKNTGRYTYTNSNFFGNRPDQEIPWTDPVLTRLFWLEAKLGAS